MKADELPVIFRFWEGEVIALFPTIPEVLGGSLIRSYMHIGQHGAASRLMTSEGRPATPEEYADLLAELRGIYETPDTLGDPEVVSLRVVRRRPRRT